MTRVSWWISIVFLGLIILFQVQIWYGKANVLSTLRLTDQVRQGDALNIQFTHRNHELYQRIEALRADKQTLAVIARRDLGMIRKGETFYQIKTVGKP